MDQKVLKQLDELQKAVAKITATMVTKDDLTKALVNHPTKNDMAAMEERLTKEIREVEIDVTVNANENKAEKSALEDLETRVTKLEHN